MLNVKALVGFCNCSIFCCALLCVHSSFAIILMRKRESWLLYFICLPGVSWLMCGSSLRCHLFVCSLWVWYFWSYSLTILEPWSRDKYIIKANMSRDMRFPSMWYVRPAKPQISLRIRAVWSEPLLVAWIFWACLATDWTSFGVSKLKGRLHRLAWVYTCQNTKLLEITCRGSYVYLL